MTHEPFPRPVDGWRVKLLFDGQCPFCRHECRILGRLDRGGRLAFEDIADPAFDPSTYGLDADRVRAYIHGVLPDGTVVTGLEVFRRAYGQVGLGWLLAPTAWPVIRPLADAAYRLFARNRERLGRLFGRSCETGSCAVDPSVWSSRP